MANTKGYGYPVHRNCVNFQNGLCTFSGVAVNPYGAACPRFTPRSTTKTLRSGSALPEAKQPSQMYTSQISRAKAPLNPTDYARGAGVSNAGGIVANVQRTLDICKEYGVDVEARTTVDPTVTDSERFIREIARDIRDRYAVYYLQQYDNTGEVLRLKKLAPPTKERLIELAEVALGEGLENVYVKTREDGLGRMG